MEALNSSETSVLTRAMQHNILEDTIHHNLADYEVDAIHISKYKLGAKFSRKI
jgi:hypothetical protein